MFKINIILTTFLFFIGNINIQTYAEDIIEDDICVEQHQDNSILSLDSAESIELDQEISDRPVDKKNNAFDDDPPFEPPLPKVNKNPQSSQETASDFFKTSLYTGSATYAYPIEFPPGINKLTPNLSLNYDSSIAAGRAGWCGLGWDLNLSYIQRDVNYTPDNLNDDKFDLILNGSKYDLVYISTEDRYHTKVESNLWIKKIAGAPNQKGEYWVVREKNGQEYRFGYNLDSENTVSTRDYVWRWSLDEIKDTNGNKVFFTYQENPAPNDIGAVYPFQIKYNNEQKRVVNFILESVDRPDNFIFYDQGSKIRKTRRLKEIDIFVDTNRVRKYALNYSISPCSNRSLLTSITQYGSDGISSLPPAAFSYQEKDFGFESGINWTDPGYVREGDEAFVHSDTFDINRDGSSDYNRAFNGGNWTVRFNNGSSFGPETNWSAPGHWLHFDEFYNRYDTFDINYDGLPDLVDASGSNNWNIYLNNGEGFNSPIIWNAPEAWISYNSEDNDTVTIYDTFDINGDGLPDFVRSFFNNNWQVYLNTGNGFAPPQNWAASGHYIRYKLTEGPALEQVTIYDTFDINGDSLPDLVDTNSTTNWSVSLNNGTGFDSPINWPAPYLFISWGEAPQDYLIYNMVIDINGDGLPDYVKKNFANNNWQVYLNTGSDFGPALNWITNTPNYGIQTGEFFIAWDTLIDLNGDGLVDFVKSLNNWDVYLNKMSAIDLLTDITLPAGGTIDVSYAPSTQYDNTGTDDISDLGLMKWCVSSVIKDNGMTGAHNTHSIYTYNYADGLYDYPNKEFRGFGYAKAVEPDGDYSENYFYQDDARKGKCYKIENKDNQGNIYSKTEYSWNYQVLFPNPEEVYFTYLSQEDNFSYDGNSQNPKISRIQYPLYDNYGNIQQIIYQGDIDFQQDEKFVYNEYIYNTELWIIDKLKHTYTNSSDNLTKVKESWYAYDNGQIGDPPSEGNLTRLEEWLDTGTGNPVTTYLYNDYGNQTHITDPENHTTVTTYDDVFHTFPVQIQNAKNQITIDTYDPNTGKILSTTDPNNFTISYEYDIFKRPIKEIYPYDNSSYPTVSYQYFIDGTAPEGMLISKRENAGQLGTLDTYNFTDGFNRLIQTRAEAEDITKEIVTDTFYNSQGDIDKISIAYLAEKTNSYGAPNLSIRYVSYLYDPLKRITRITNTDGTYKTNSYFHWVTTTSNERDVPTDFFYDGYKRLVKVQEHNQQEIYTTTYLYNVLDKLTQITDAQNNQTIIEYDSLGRKITLNDPDIGIWHYAYDKSNNLVSKTDALGTVISYEYDELNRIKKKEYATDEDTAAAYDAAVTYTYDLDTIGTMSEMHNSSAATYYYYDNRKRLIREERIIDAVTYTTQWAYDALDRVISIIYPDTEEVAFTYNPQGKIEDISNYVNNIDYNAQGKIIRKEYTNGIVTELTYNEDDLRLNHIYASGIQDLTFGYDNCGNTASVADAISGVTQNFQYDDLNRLTFANGLYGSKVYNYDSIGNVILKDGVVYTYGQSAGPHAITSGSDGSVFSYDANGNMISRNEDGIVQNYEYDFENRLAKVTVNGSTKAAFTYDGSNTRVKKTIYNNIFTPSEVDQINKVAFPRTEITVYVNSLYEKAGNVSTKHIFLEKDKVISKTQNNIYYYHYDHIGSSDVITNQSAAQVQLLEYAPYGEIILNEGQNVTDYKFTGKELDETGLYFYGARYYDAQIGRFTIADPVEPDIDKPQSLNRYTYCLNNPLTFIDPSGNWPISEDDDKEDKNRKKGWGSNLADMLDESVEETFSFYTEDIIENYFGVTAAATAADLAKGMSDLFRLGESTSKGFDYFQEGNYLMGASEILFDVSRAASLGATVAGVGESTFGTLRHTTDAAGAEGIANSGKIMSKSGDNFFSPKKYGTGAETQIKNAMDKTPTHYIDVPRYRIGGYVRGPKKVTKGGPPRPTGGSEYYSTKPVKVYKHEIKPFIK